MSDTFGTTSDTPAESEGTADEEAEYLRENDEPVQESTVIDPADVLQEYGEDVSSSPASRAREDGA
ncbi:hypothetical protein CLV49_0473 [Labedella gwakjiensis]|uniref:Uncharacterized protein n=1 Tax=Labedella gwakjiensis TaxID=390269 RepID=A0A2P8GSD3_9MICO|nr:hypothetical protein [Labedella gwakjiensis]PSL36871.1 hypothetical protein CLV49_0473 [Labedella gwakjiensis]RUQ84369.1 hypothetical protein ELQ93_16345 [Labedella gwakjiensis]